MKLSCLFVLFLVLASGCEYPEQPTLDNPYDTGEPEVVFPPQDLRVYSENYASITLTWTLTTSRASSIRIERSIANQLFEH